MTLKKSQSSGPEADTLILGLEEAIFSKIQASHVIVSPTGMYSTYSKWIKREINGAKTYAKPILAVTPSGQEKQSGVVLGNAEAEVGWNKKSVVIGIWKLFRG